MSKTARNRALETLSAALLDGTERRFLAQAPLMAIVEAVLVLDENGLLVDPEVADLDPDEPIPYTVTMSPKNAEFAEASARADDYMKRSIAAGGVPAALLGAPCSRCKGSGKVSCESTCSRVDCAQRGCVAGVGDSTVACPDCDPAARQPNAATEPDSTPCPECGVPVGLSGGCNNIDCKLCPF